jgi:DNA-directed RNA polymerase subunit RPC12/RpoP
MSDDRPRADFVTDPYPCPGCGSQNDAHRAVNEMSAPKEGDQLVCAYCGTIGTIDGGTLRRATPAEQAEVVASMPAELVLWLGGRR